MAASRIDPVLKQLRKAVLRSDQARVTDGRLLENFITNRDPAAFEALVRRHGPMVLGVCRRVLRNSHDAEDAFQATFLVLARKAASVWPRQMVGNWLYGVGHRTALHARAANARRHARERQVVEMPEPETVPPEPWHELRMALDEELARLPDKYRLSIVLCDLEGRSRREVAQQFQVPEGTLSSRLTTARRILARRLARRGLAVTAGSLVLALSHDAASGCVPLSLVRSTVEAAGLIAARQAANMVRAPVVALTEGVLKSMMLTKLKVVGTVLVLGMVALGGVLLTHQRLAAQQEGTGPGLPAEVDVGQPLSQQGKPRNPTGTEPRQAEKLPQAVADYLALFDQALAVVSDYFTIEDSNRYEGRIDTFPALVKPATDRRADSPAIRRRAQIRITPVEDGTFSVAVRVFRETERKARPASQEAGWKPSGRDTELEQVILQRLTARRIKAKQDGEPAAEQRPPLVERRVRQYHLELILFTHDPDDRAFPKEDKGKALVELIVPEGQEGRYLSGGQVPVVGDEQVPVEFLEFGLGVRARVLGLSDGRVRLEVALERTKPDRADDRAVQTSGRIVRSIATVKLGEGVTLIEEDDGGQGRRWLRVRVVKEETIFSQSRSAETETKAPRR
jgi:RNA polymerase sigma factor (sigma-70 family)